MKSKPKLDQEQKKDAFMSGADAPEKRADQVEKMPKRKKLVELPEEVFIALKDRAHADFKKTGRHVTETEIIIAALKKHLEI